MGNESSASTASRLKGYNKCLEEYAINAENCIFRYGDYSYDNGHKIAKALIKDEEKFTAICCQNDDMAIGAIKAMKEMGLSVPGNISVCGYDGTNVAAMFDPSITTVRRPILLALELAMTKLFDLINGSTSEGNKNIMLEPELIDGKSIKHIE
jgi:LacI family transcriptional regulator